VPSGRDACVETVSGIESRKTDRRNTRDSFGINLLYVTAVL